VWAVSDHCNVTFVAGTGIGGIRGGCVVERADMTKQGVASRVEARVVVGLHEGQTEDFADVLLAADYAAATGAQLVVVATESRWPRALAALSCLSCATGLAYAETAERILRDEMADRIEAVVGLVGVSWELRWSTGSCTKALLRYVRRNPRDMVVFRRTQTQARTVADGAVDRAPAKPHSEPA
jgi:hypothetical protein